MLLLPHLKGGFSLEVDMGEMNRAIGQIRPENVLNESSRKERPTIRRGLHEKRGKGIFVP